jgi:ubiquinone/menaquinone biosynthesis C-methylase UbiE
MPVSEPTHHLRPAAAFVRACLDRASWPEARAHLAEADLDTLSPDDLASIVARGQDRGLRLHRFKRTMRLPRVARVLGVLRSLQPRNLLDIGSGRGVFLWPLIEEFPELEVTALDRLEHRVETLRQVVSGGCHRLSVVSGDCLRLPFADRSFEVVTMLEVLEHIPGAGQALAEVVRVAARAVVVSVPSKPDDNPEHVHLFNQTSLRALFASVGIERVNFHFVHNHLLAVAVTA